MRAAVGRVIRRGFFRIVLLLFLVLLVLPFMALKVLANPDSGNRIMREVVGRLFDTSNAEVTWDEDRTTFTGPTIALTGTITYYNLRIHRRTGATPHPARKPLNYDFLTVPKVEIDYDLKRLPDLPVRAVKLESGLVLYFNIHKGTWIDEDLFVKGSGGSTDMPVLPEIIAKGDCAVKLRADGILVPPEQVSQGMEWYDMNVRELSLLPSQTDTDRFAIEGSLTSKQFGQFNVGGSVDRKAQHVDVLFRTVKPISFNRQYASVLASDVRDAVEQFQITATATLQGKLEIEPGKDLQFSAGVDADDGSICYVGFPLSVSDVHADIQVHNNNIIVDATGHRDGANVHVYARVEAVGSNNELLKVNVDVHNLLVDEDFRLALLPERLQPDNLKNWETGMPFTKEEWTNIDFQPVTGYPDWNKGLLPDTDTKLAPDIDPILPFICRAFAPMGLADFQLRLDQEMKGRDPVTHKSRLDQTLNWKVFIKDATAAYVGLPEQTSGGFPVPIHSAYGVVEGSTSPGNPGRYVVRGYTPEELEQLGLDPAGGYQAYGKDGLTGVLASQGEQLWVYAVYDEANAPGEKSKLRLEFKSNGLDFNNEIKSRLPDNIREVVDQFAPTGKVDIQRASVVVQPEGDGDVQFDFTLTAKNVAAQYQFPDAPEPAKFREVAGTIHIEGARNRVELSNLRGKLLGSPVSLNLTYVDGDIPSFTVESDDFELRPEFTRILPTSLGETLKRFDPRGYVKFNVAGRRGEKFPDFTDVDVTFVAGSGERSGSVRFDAFPYTITDVTGRLFVHVSEDWADIVIRDFSGRGSELPGQTDPSRISVNGQVLVPISNLSGDEPDAEKDGDGSENPDDAPAEKDDAFPILDLRFEVTRVPVDTAMLMAFTKMLQDPNSEDKPLLVDFIEKLHMGGTIGTSGRLVTDADGNFDWQFEIMLEGTSIKFEGFPYPIEGLYGSVIVDHTEVSMRNVQGRAEEGTITLHNATYSAEDGWQITLSARDLSFDKSPALRDALPAGLRDVSRKLNPRGDFDIDLELSGKDDYMHYQVSLDIFKTDLELGLHFDDMTARFDMEGVFEGEHSRQNGTVYVKEVFFKNARFNDLTTSLQYFDDRVEFPNLRGRFYDGWVEGRFGINADNYSGEIEIRGANLQQLGETAFPDAGELVGALDAELLFHSELDRFGQIGRGRVDVQPFDRKSDDPKKNTAKLLEVPLFSQIAAVTGSEANFDEGHVYFWLGPDRITIREMDFVSDAARVETFGGDDENYIMYDTAQMRMKLFFTLAPRSPIPLPGIQLVLDWLKQILFPLFVTGTLNAPDVQPFSLTADQLEGDQFPRRPKGP